MFIFDRRSVLDKTLREWEVEGVVEGGVDVVSVCCRFLSGEGIDRRPLCGGCCHDRIWDGDRQE